MTLWNSQHRSTVLHTKKVWDNQSIVELAAQLSCHCEAFLGDLGACPEVSLQRYWRASRVRWEGWMRSLKHYHAAAEHASEVEWSVLWRHTRALAAEVLASEPLTRLWGALVAAGPRAEGECVSEPITRCVLSNHTAVADYVMNLLDHAPRVPRIEASELKHLHFHSRRWSDLVLAPLIDRDAVEPFAVDVQRSAEFYTAYFQSPTRPDVFWRLFATSVRFFFRRYSLQTAPSTDANRDIVECILSCWPADLLESEAALLEHKPHRRSKGVRTGRGRLDGLV